MANKKSSAAAVVAAAKAKIVDKIEPVPFPENFKVEQARKAVTALLAHHAKEKERISETQLMAKDEHVWLVVNTKQMPTKKSLKPVRIPLPHPALPPPPKSSVCLFTRSPQREYKDLLAAHNIKFVDRVVGVEKLRGKHKPFEARRALMKAHDIFLCDAKIMPSMPKLLGKIFFDAKKQPIPVTLARKDLKAELARAISSAFFHESLGTCTSIRIATASREDPEDSHSADEVMENLMAALPAVVSRITGQWDNVKSIGIKTSGSIMLPIWTSDINSLHIDADEKVLSRSEKAVKRGLIDEDDSDDSVMHNDSEEEAPKSKKQKKTAATSTATATKAEAKSTPSKKGAAAPATAAATAATKAKSPAGKTKAAAVDIPLPPAAKPAAAAKEPKKVMAGKPTAAAVASKKKAPAASASAKVKQSVVGKKKVGKK
ncbi:hypothetical protein QFC24_006904 [Naganishia onofrii]|uniref:Uncharacterized protein n=1 Tax=Naganishia onofrii TaxID=1851511 RepID=A0ACC2WYC1_9TREE|nr:hypothetical protein QFC24_006904 [Naganishia onofrii]